MRASVLFFIAVFLISDVFCYSRKIMLEKRKWQPLSWFEPLLSCNVKTNTRNKFPSYGCYCGTAIDTQFNKKPIDDVDTCCQKHKKCLEEYTNDHENSYCSSSHLINCEKM
ncbi:arachidonic acid secretion [Desmophyllum pertusum]|uniref:phospholipase A2 n=1 Tax=Desmophyllum pertusum TaxID=174260 RepID=A0A9W9YMX7_9CNID|nr:arachidonic acid secretion [Desmophyllum pertusum]